MAVYVEVEIEEEMFDENDEEALSILEELKATHIVGKFCSMRIVRPIQGEYDLYWLDQHSNPKCRIPIVDDETAIKLCNECEQYETCPTLNEVPV